VIFDVDMVSVTMLHPILAKDVTLWQSQKQFSNNQSWIYTGCSSNIYNCQSWTSLSNRGNTPLPNCVFYSYTVVLKEGSTFWTMARELEFLLLQLLR